jgi:GTP-binding protein EngB required for normal cell division
MSSTRGQVPAGPAAGGPAVGGRPSEWLSDGIRVSPAVSGAATAEQRGTPFRIASELSARLGALARLVQIGTARRGPDGFSRELLDDADALLARAGQRLRLSSAHTVVALAGGTGSGKSSLFNRISGADFSTVGVTRPVTREVHACVWGVSGSGALLDWLGVPRRFRYARASALDSGEQALTGLVLLDMPDHDSVMSHASDQVDRLVELADLMIWVLDPQKYADAAVHRRFLVPLAGHSEVVAVVLNQSDMLAPAQIEDCVQDLRRLLDAEGLPDVQILVTSATTGAGVDALRQLLLETVSERNAAVARIAADVDGVATRFVPYAGEENGAARSEAALAAGGPSGPGAAPSSPGGISVAVAGTGTAAQAAQAAGANGAVDASAAAGADAAQEKAVDSVSAARILAGSPARLAIAFAKAAGVTAIGDALQSARELRAVDYVGWPISWLFERLTKRDPVRKIKLGKLWAELRGVTAGPSGAQQAEIDNALTELADQVSPGLPRPWSHTIRKSIRSRADKIPTALGDRIGAALPAENKVAGWWRAVGVWQGLLLGCIIVGFAWIAAIVVFGVFYQHIGVPHLFRSLSLLPLIGILIVAMLLLGWLTSSACLNAVRSAAIRENDEVAESMQDGIAGVAKELVVAPAQQELSELDRFRAELRVALGKSA